MRSEERIRVGLVLSAGGLRGVAHLGVLRRLLQCDVPVQIIVGVSAGAVVGAYFAAVGLSVEDMIAEAHHFRGRHLVCHGLSLRTPQFMRPFLRSLCGTIPWRLEQLEGVQFDRLHHGIVGLGIVCHDLLTNRPLYFATGSPRGATLAEVVKASAAIPGLIPTHRVRRNGVQLKLTDGGISDSLPLDFAMSGGLEATHIIASDCRREAPPVASRDNLVYIRPALTGTGVLRSPRDTLIQTVRQGEAAVTPEIIERIRAWSR